MDSGRRGNRTHISRFVGPGFYPIELAAHFLAKISLRLTSAIPRDNNVRWDPTLLREGDISRA